MPCFNHTIFPQVIEDFIHYFKKIRDPTQNPKNILWQKEKDKLQQEKRQNTIKAKRKAKGLPESTEKTKKKNRPPAKPKEPKVAIIFSESTDYGLAVTLKAILELAEFLCKKCGFKYLMTALLNQDCLEVSKMVS